MAKRGAPPPRVVIGVPRRDGNRERDLTWAWVRRWWQEHFPEWGLFEGHHLEGPFNRSAAVNRAAGYADWQQEQPWDVLVIIDSDVIADPELVRQGVQLALESGRMVLPFDVRLDLNQRGSARVMGGHQGNWRRFVQHTYTDMCSSVVIVSRALWDATGGFDEGFVGWGFEDNAFAAACETFGGGPPIKLHGDVWHFWHPTATEGKRGTPSHQRNRARADRYLAVRGDREATRALRELAPPAFEHRPVGIPRILHRVVPESTSAQVEAWWTGWVQLHPEWEVRTHRDPLEPAAWPETSAAWPACQNGAELADLVRLEALLRWGGVYLDSDVEPYRSLEPLLPLSAFAAWEDGREVPNAVLGAVPGHPAIRACLDLALARIAQPTWERGPGVTTAVLPGRADVLLLPPGSFYPYHYSEMERRLEPHREQQPWAFGAHHWHGSWLPEAQRPINRKGKRR
jgi:hypothetical protein